jgi:hypothetical protein
MTEDLALTIKDVLREIRFAARREVRCIDRRQAEFRSYLLGTGKPVNDGSPGRLYELSSALAAPVGRTAQRLLQSRDVVLLDDSFLVPISVSLAALARDETSTLFAESYYRGGHYSLDKLGISNVFMSEQTILKAVRPVARQHAVWLERAAAGSTAPGDYDQQLEIVAEATCAVINAIPIKRVDRWAGDGGSLALALADLNTHCFLSVGIATAVVSATKLADGVGVADIMESAELVAAARDDRFTTALKEANPAAGLARELAAVVPYLP